MRTSDKPKSHDEEQSTAAPSESEASATSPGPLYFRMALPQSTPGASSEDPHDGAALRDMERVFGTSFRDVTLRADDTTAQRASALGVTAYTDGREIGFGRGAFAPESREGRRVLAHELAHVVQARGGTGGGHGRHALGAGVQGYSPPSASSCTSSSPS